LAGEPYPVSFKRESGSLPLLVQTHEGATYRCATTAVKAASQAAEMTQAMRSMRMVADRREVAQSDGLITERWSFMDSCPPDVNAFFSDLG